MWGREGDGKEKSYCRGAKGRQRQPKFPETIIQASHFKLGQKSWDLC